MLLHTYMLHTCTYTGHTYIHVTYMYIHRTYIDAKCSLPSPPPPSPPKHISQTTKTHITKKNLSLIQFTIISDEQEK